MSELGLPDFLQNFIITFSIWGVKYNVSNLVTFTHTKILYYFLEQYLKD